MFGTIRRHQGWLWWFIGGITVISFVLLGPNSCNDIKLSGLAGGGGYGKIGDHNITQEELRQAIKEVTLRYFFTTGKWPTDKTEFNVTREAYIRLFLIDKQKQFGIEAAPESQAELAKRILGNFGAARLDDLVNQILKPQGFDEADLERFLAHEVEAQQLVTTAGLSGKLVTPGEAETLYREEHQELACSMILFSATNYLPSVEPGNKALLSFYTNHMAAYREPARVEVNYVKFNVTNYWADTIKSLTNLNADVDAEVKKAGTNLVGHAKTPEESRAVIKDALIRREALKSAQREAGAFANELYNLTPRKPENIETLAKQKGLTVKTTEPFDELSGPKDLEVLYNFPKMAFQLSEDEPFGKAAVEQDGVYVLGFKKQIPSMVPPYKDVEARVTEDFRYVTGGFAAEQSAQGSYKALTNGLAQGKTFTVLAAEMRLKTESLPPISLSTTKLPEAVEDKVSLDALRQAAFSTQVGNVSAPARTQRGVFLLYVEKRLPVDEAKLKTELPGFLAYLRQARQGDAFNQWFSVQVRQDPAFAATLQRSSEESQMRSSSRRAK